MTARNQPHKYRCETCKERFDSEHIEYLHERCPMSVWLNTHLKLELLYSHIGVKILWLITSIVGCASHSSATKAEPHGRLKCPKCNGPVFIANIDDADSILCMNDACKWKQKIVAEPDITLSAVVGFEAGQREAEQRIADAVDELQSEIDNPDGADYQDAILTALALLRGKGE